MLLFKRKEDASSEELSYGRLLSEIAEEGPVFVEPEYEEEVEAQYED